MHILIQSINKIFQYWVPRLGHNEALITQKRIYDLIWFIFLNIPFTSPALLRFHGKFYKQIKHQQIFIRWKYFVYRICIICDSQIIKSNFWV